MLREPANARNRASETALSGGYRLAGEALALVYIGLIAAIASTTGAFYVLFPELGALAHDVFTRPRGTWAKAPLMLAITPPLTGALGICITRELPYGFVSVFAVVCGSMGLVLMLRSPIAPAISAGLLPLVLGVRSWWYPPGILLGTALLAILSIGRTRWLDDRAVAQSPRQAPDEIDDTIERSPADYRWLVPLLAFVMIATAMVQATGLRFILFPPLVVIGFEMFGHTEICPWAARPLSLPMACFLTASGGLILLRILGVNPATAALSMAWGVVVLRVFDLHVPPALAVALLPMVMDHPANIYPFSVGIGTLILTLWFLAWKVLLRQERRRKMTGGAAASAP